MKFDYLRSKNGTIIDGPILIKPNVYEDNRGFFLESWNKRVFNKLVKLEVEFLQDNHSNSSKGVLRGLHYQLPPKEQKKLIRCTKGKIFDVIVDIRRNSKTFGDWTYSELSSETKNQLWIPEGFAHGFLALSEVAEVEYKTDNYWAKEYERSIKWDDKEINISWPLSKINILKPILGVKDKAAPSFEKAIQLNEIF